jgi:hypothetical protein
MLSINQSTATVEPKTQNVLKEIPAPEMQTANFAGCLPDFCQRQNFELLPL